MNTNNPNTIKPTTNRLLKNNGIYERPLRVVISGIPPQLRWGPGKPEIPNDEIDYYRIMPQTVSEDGRAANTRLLENRWRQQRFPVQFWNSSAHAWDTITNPSWDRLGHYRRGPIVSH
jgi:hypothetical protein